MVLCLPHLLDRSEFSRQMGPVCIPYIPLPVFEGGNSDKKFSPQSNANVVDTRCENFIRQTGDSAAFLKVIRNLYICYIHVFAAKAIRRKAS